MWPCYCRCVLSTRAKAASTYRPNGIGNKWTIKLNDYTIDPQHSHTNNLDPEYTFHYFYTLVNIQQFELVWTLGIRLRSVTSITEYFAPFLLGNVCCVHKCVHAHMFLIYYCRRDFDLFVWFFFNKLYFKV